MIRWFANNGIAANLLLIGILAGGIYTALNRVPLEVTPAVNWNTVYMQVKYPGATPKDVEKDILIPVEEALEGIKGIKSLNADGHRGRAKFYFRAEKNADLNALLDDIQTRVDSISTFPPESERPYLRIADSTAYSPVISIAVTGKLNETDLRRVARRVQQDVLELDGVSRVDLDGDRDNEISIEADLEKLRSYQLGFSDLADAIRRSSVDLPAGSIQSDSGTLVLGTRGQAYNRVDFENIPIRAANGAELRLGEVAVINDGFVRDKVLTDFNGQPAMFVEVMRSSDESAIKISDSVHEYVDSSSERFPDGVELYTWDDKSLSIRGRLGTLTWSLLQGCLLVFIVLGLFLRPQVAFWVVIGIPISFAGGVLMMPVFGVTANVMSLFGFIIVLGVVVDDAIVTGENVYSKLRTRMDPLEAAIVGTQEVTVPVTFGVLTTIAAFMPLMTFDGHWGEFARQIPPVVAPVLLFSLVESKLVLPSHLKHVRIRNQRIGFFGRIQRSLANGLEWVVEHVYSPCLKVVIAHRFSVLAVFVAMALAMAGYCAGGRIGFVSFPSVENLRVTAHLNLPNDLTIEDTGKYVDRITAATETLKKEYIDPGSGESLIRNVAKTTGSSWLGGRYDHSRGNVIVEVLPPSLRSEPGPRNSEIAQRWTELVGEIEEADSFYIKAEITGKWRDDDDEDVGEPMEIELRGPHSEEKNEIANKIKELLQNYDGINGAWSGINRGQDEIELRLKPRAAELKISQQMLAQQVRQAFFGEEAQRVQRGSDDIQVMVRLPRQSRESLHTLQRIKIRNNEGAEVPLDTVADFEFTTAPTFVERNDGAEVIELGASPRDETVDIIGIARELEPAIAELVNSGKDLSFQFTGHIAEHEESKRRTLIGALGLLFVLYTLLAIPFKSALQPIYVLLALPFGVIGALLGHMIMDITPSWLSVFGMLALAGVVVNDSLVMVDYINRRRREGAELMAAALDAGARRFRPILLTSVTTFVGLVPLLMDNSLQAQFLIPMAVSLGFGVLFATAITLFLIPCALLVADDIGKFLRRF